MGLISVKAETVEVAPGILQVTAKESYATGVEVEKPPEIKKLQKDIRSWYDGSETIKSFDFQVLTDQDSTEITLDFTLLDVPEEYNAFYA